MATGVSSGGTVTPAGGLKVAVAAGLGTLGNTPVTIAANASLDVTPPASQHAQFIAVVVDGAGVAHAFDMKTLATNWPANYIPLAIVHIEHGGIAVNTIVDKRPIHQSPPGSLSNVLLP